MSTCGIIICLIISVLIGVIAGRFATIGLDKYIDDMRNGKDGKD